MFESLHRCRLCLFTGIVSITVALLLAQDFDTKIWTTDIFMRVFVCTFCLFLAFRSTPFR